MSRNEQHSTVLHFYQQTVVLKFQNKIISAAIFKVIFGFYSERTVSVAFKICRKHE